MFCLFELKKLNNGPHVAPSDIYNKDLRPVTWNLLHTVSSCTAFVHVALPSVLCHAFYTVLALISS